MNEDTSVIMHQGHKLPPTPETMNRRLVRDEKKYVLSMLFQGYANGEISRGLKENFKIEITSEAIAYWRKKWRKQIIKHQKNELEEAKVSEPLAVLGNRLARYQEIYELAKADEAEVVSKMTELEYDHRTGKINNSDFHDIMRALKQKRNQILSVMNDAVKNAGTDVATKEKIEQHERDLMVRSGNIESKREILAEVIEQVGNKMKKATIHIKENSRISSMLDWEDDDYSPDAE
jgi:hypothetical protein